MVSHGSSERQIRSSVNEWQVWVCVMFAALNIDRNNIQNAVSDNMLEDLNLTKADYVSCPLKQSCSGRL